MANDTDHMMLIEDENATCSTTGCKKCQHGTLKRAFFAIAFMALGGLAALAMYPELADYAYPLIGNPSDTGFTGEHPCPADRVCPAGSLHSNFPLLSSPEGSDFGSRTIPGGCTETDSTTCCEPLKAATKSSDEAPADAISAVESSGQDRSN